MTFKPALLVLTYWKRAFTHTTDDNFVPPWHLHENDIVGTNKEKLKMSKQIKCTLKSFDILWNTKINKLLGDIEFMCSVAYIECVSFDVFCT